MNKNSVYFRYIAVFALMLALVLSGCGSTGAGESTIELRKNGSIRAVYVSDFPKDRYNSILLEEEIRETVKAYNTQADAKAIQFRGISSDEDTVRVTMQYRTWSDYAAFNHQNVFFGTVTDGISEGILPADLTLTDPETKGTVSPASLKAEEESGNAKYRVFMIEDSIAVSSNWKAAYTAGPVTTGEDGVIRINEGLSKDSVPEPGYIVFKI